jgi:hypothetical protein
MALFRGGCQSAEMAVVQIRAYRPGNGVSTAPLEGPGVGYIAQIGKKRAMFTGFTSVSPGPGW